MPAAIPNDETDGKAENEWQSRYPIEARREIRLETLYVVIVLFASLAGLLAIWDGALSNWVACSSCKDATLRKYAYFFDSGVFGGTLFGGKYLYHVVARGFWHQDRRLWRILSPWLAGSLALAIGTLMDAGFLGLAVKRSSPAVYVSLGFITGYFGDKALAKMSEIADVIFGVRHPSLPKPKDESTPHTKQGKKGE